MLLNKTPITTHDKTITVRGKVIYNDRRRRIDIKKPLCDLFPEGNVEYVMELCTSKQQSQERVEELARENIVPVLMYFNKGDDHEMPRVRQHKLWQYR